MVESLVVGETYLFKEIPFEDLEIKYPSRYQLQLKEYVVVKITDNSIKVARAMDKDEWDFQWYTKSNFDSIFTLIEKL